MLSVRAGVGKEVGAARSGAQTAPAALLAMVLFAAVYPGLLPPRASAAATQAVEEVKVTLKPTGFEPAELTRAAGAFRLRVVNSSNRENLNFRVIKATGEEVFRGATTAGASDWSAELNLPAGRYVLTEADHPEWALNISVL